jgi:hypothetical protein
LKQDQNRFINIESAKNVAVITSYSSLVAVIYVTSIMMSSSAIKLPTSVLAQGKQNFTANLIGQDEVPPTNSKATGNSTLIPSSDGMNIKYELNVEDIDNVTTAQIQQGKKGGNGPVVVTLIQFKAKAPTVPVDGLLAEGNIAADKPQGPLRGKQISDLTTLIGKNNAYVNILTKQNPEGEIRGQIFD